MSEASAHKLAFVKEVTRGTTPATPKFTRLPDTRTTIALTKETLASERITGTRIPAEPRAGLGGVSGDIPVDLSDGTYDEFIASALQGSWADVAGAQLDVCEITSSVSGANAGIVAGSTFDTDATAITVTVESIDAKEEKILLSFDQGGGFETVELNGTSSPENEVNIDGETFSLTDLTDLSESKFIRASNARRSFSLLREFSDQTGKPFILFSGLEVSALNITAATNQIAKGVFSFMGRSHIGPSANAPDGSEFLPAVDSEAYDTFTGDMKIDNVATCIVTDYSLTIDNGLQARYAVGCDSPQDPSVGQSSVSGSLTLYFEDSTIYEKYVDEESIALELTLADTDGDTLTVKVPNCHMGTGTQPDVSGDGPITLTVPFTAHGDPSIGDSHIEIIRTRALAA